jgi:hypothetical protein
MLPVIALGIVVVMCPTSGYSRETSSSVPSSINQTQSLLTAESDTAGQDSWEKYQIILQRNIFSRQRGPVHQSRAAQARPVITRNRESYLILKGVVQQDGTFIAFVENTQNNSTLRLREGDSIARGTVKNFTLDSIEYQLEDKAISVMVGRDLEGGQGTLPMSTLLEMSATSPLTSDPNTPTRETTPSGDEAEILKKLMEQRKQQLGQ